MPKWNTVSIVGVGLIGGSIGLALRTRGLAGRVVGIGRRQQSLDTALQIGAIDSATTDLAQGVAEAELVVVATPIERIVEHVRQVAAACPVAALITDAGSTKGEIVAELERALPKSTRFVGSHPLAGSEKHGPIEAKVDLLSGRVVVITPTAATPPDVRERVEEFWTDLGARVVTLSPELHDERLAAASHVPHLVAALLARATPVEALPFVAGGFRDTTRIAAGDPELWAQILLANRSEIIKAVAPFEAALSELRSALERADGAAIRRVLMEAKSKRDAVGS